MSNTPSTFHPGAEAAQRAMGPAHKIVVRPHPLGTAGVRVSLQEVAERIQKGMADPRIVAWARQAIHANGAPQDTKGRAQAILTQLRKEVSYIPDPVNVEFMAAPANILCLDKFGLCFRGGDCFPETTLLLRDDFAFVPIKDIKPGDRIWGHDKWTRVEAKVFKGKLAVDAVHMNNGSTFQVTGDHHVPVIRCDRHSGRVTSAPCQCAKRDCRIEKVRVRDLKPKDRLVQPDRVDFGRGAMDPGRAYVEGLYVSDGWHEDYRFSISGQDGCPKEAQKLEVKAICDRLGIPVRWHRKYIVVRDSRWTSRVHEMGARAPEKRLLSIDLDEATAAETLRGVMADSGAITNGGGSRSFTTTSHRLMLQTRVLLRMFGVSCGSSYIVDHGGLGENPIWRLNTREGNKLPKILRVKAIDRQVRETDCYDIQTEDHYVYLPEHDVTVNNCDELVITYASATLAVGIPTQIIGESFNESKIAEHVLCAIQDTDADEWLHVDPSTQKPVGEYVKGTNEEWIDPLNPKISGATTLAGGNFVGVGHVHGALGQAGTLGATTATGSNGLAIAGAVAAAGAIAGLVYLMTSEPAPAPRRAPVRVARARRRP